MDSSIDIIEPNSTDGILPQDVTVGADSSPDENDGEPRSAGSLKLKLDQFEGPFDLLLTLLSRQSIEITDISISQVTDQYLEVIFEAGMFKVEIGSEFLVMAAALIHMKTRKLLPKPQEEEPGELTEEQLAQHIELYKQYKAAAEALAGRYELWQDAITRPQEVMEFPKLQESVELDSMALISSYERVKLRFETLRNDNKEKMDVILKIEKVSLRDKIRQVVKVIRSRISVRFSEIFNRKSSSVPEVVTGFLAVLELDRRERVVVNQNEPFGEIEIRRKDDDLADLDIDLEEYNEWDDGE
ncbi:MAG: segregation/condensation protein A [Clostridia bacterium]|nr:segregation/condensation protein A [Clostridia bacterium]